MRSPVKFFRKSAGSIGVLAAVVAIAASGLTACGKFEVDASKLKSMPPTTSDPLKAEQESTAKQQTPGEKDKPLLSRKENDALLQDLFEQPRTHSDQDLVVDAQKAKDEAEAHDESPDTKADSGAAQVDDDDADESSHEGQVRDKPVFVEDRTPEVRDPLHDVIPSETRKQQGDSRRKEPQVRDALHDTPPSPSAGGHVASGRKEPKVRDALHDTPLSQPSSEQSKPTRKEPSVRDSLHDTLPSAPVQGSQQKPRLKEPAVRDSLHDTMPVPSQPTEQTVMKPAKPAVQTEPIEVQPRPENSRPQPAAPKAEPKRDDPPTNGVTILNPSRPETTPETTTEEIVPDPQRKSDPSPAHPKTPTAPAPAPRTTAPKVSATASNGTPAYSSELCERINVASRELEVDLSGIALEDGQLPATLPVQYFRSVERIVKERGLKMSASQLKKNHFVCVLLPIALRMNAQVFKQRLEVLRIEAKQKTGQALKAEESRWIEELKTSYRLPATSSLRDLLERVDIVPVALLIAQAAEESGWGTSRAAEVANNIFGMHGVPGKDCEPAQGNSKVCLRKFATITEGIAGYIRYMNTGKAQFHMRFRKARAQMRTAGQALDSVTLAGTLSGYSESGEAYCRQIKSMMSDWNNLTKYEFKEETVTAAQEGRPVDPAQ